jgi:N-acetylglucosamine kinase-like BadF-type ATPase
MDVGGSRTRALLAGLDGEILGIGETGPGNPEVVGYDGLAAAMRDAFAAAIGEHNDFVITGAGLGVAGFDWESERADTMAAIAKLGLSCPIVLKNDSALGLAAGSSEGWGINIAAGTSNNCYGLSREGREGRLAGGGGLLGENGGALEIVAAAVVQINYARILRGPETSLTELFCARAAAPDPDAFVEGLTCGRISPRASWAPDVFAAARAGDEVANGIVAWAGAELGESAAAVARQIGIQNDTFEVLLSGSLFDLEPSLEKGIVAVLTLATPRARISRLNAPPVIGAVLLAATAAGRDPRAIKPRLLKTIMDYSNRG